MSTAATTSDQRYETRIQQLLNKVQELQQHNQQCDLKIHQYESQALLLSQQNQSVQDLYNEQVQAAEIVRVELMKAQSDLAMVEAVGKLQKKMSEMKDREIKMLKEQVAELDRQLKSKREDNKQEVDSEGIEMLRAKLTSLSFLNQQGAELQAQLRSNLEYVIQESKQKDLEISDLSTQNSDLTSQMELLSKQLEELHTTHSSAIQDQQDLKQQIELLTEEKMSAVKLLQETKSTAQMNEAMLKFQQSQLNLKITQSEKKIEEGAWQLNLVQAENTQLKQEIIKLNEDQKIIQPIIQQVEQKPVQQQQQFRENPQLTQLNETLNSFKQNSQLLQQAQQRERSLVKELNDLRSHIQVIQQQANLSSEIPQLTKNIDALQTQLSQAQLANQNLMTSLQTSRDEVLSLRSQLVVLEEANRAVIRDLSTQISTMAANAVPKEEINTKLQEIANKTYATVRGFMENKQNGQNLDIERFRKQWHEIRTERDREKKIMEKLISSLRKTYHSAQTSQKLDKVFDYFTEQLDVLKTYSLKQIDYFNEMTESFKLKIRQPDNHQMQESLSVQLAQQESQIKILQKQLEDAKKQLKQYQTVLVPQIRQDSDQRYKQYHDTKSELLRCLQTMETQNAELETIRAENRIQSRILEDRQAEIIYLRDRLEKVMHDAHTMSRVRQEFQAQGTQAELQRNAEGIQIQNQELKVREQELRMRVQELESVLSIFKEDYQLMKSQYLQQLDSSTKKPQIQQQESKPLTLASETQTDDAYLQQDSHWLQLYIQDEQLALSALSDKLLCQIEQLLAVFFAYSRSESKIDEKEVQMQSVITEKDRQLGEVNQMLTEAQGANKEFKDKIGQYQTQIAQLQQSAQQAAAVPSTGRVVTQGTNVQANKALETRVQALIKEKQELEQLVTRIRAESAQNSKQQQIRMNEMKAEIEKLNAIKAGIPQQNQPPVFQTMLMTLRRAQNVLSVCENVQDNNQEEKKQ